MKKILFNGLGNRGWIGGIYYIKNIIFSCLQNKGITSKYELVLFIDEKHADIFEPFRGQITIRVFGKEGKLKLAWAQAKQVWFGGVKYCYALELNKTGKFFKNKGIFWIPDFQHKNLPEFFSKEELERKDANFLEMVMSDRPMVLSSFDAKMIWSVFIPNTNVRWRWYTSFPTSSRKSKKLRQSWRKTWRKNSGCTGIIFISLTSSGSTKTTLSW